MIVTVQQQGQQDLQFKMKMVCFTHFVIPNFCTHSM